MTAGFSVCCTTGPGKNTIIFLNSLFKQQNETPFKKVQMAKKYNNKINLKFATVVSA